LSPASASLLMGICSLMPPWGRLRLSSAIHGWMAIALAAGAAVFTTKFATVVATLGTALAD